MPINDGHTTSSMDAALQAHPGGGVHAEAPMTPNAYNKSQGLMSSGFYRDSAETVQDKILRPDRSPTPAKSIRTMAPAPSNNAVSPLGAFGALNDAIGKMNKGQ